MAANQKEPTVHLAPWRERIHEIIFEADTRAGKVFDIVLMVLILLSILSAMLESIESIDRRYHAELVAAEWVFTVLFTIEYALRLVSVRKKLRYALSFFGIVDLLAILPMYLTLLGLGTHYGVMVRTLRLLRIFRVFKLARYLSEAGTLRAAMIESRAKITVFLTTVLILICVVGSAMHVVEGPEHGFDSIPESIYWAVVTVTTVGYGDISPQTPEGKALASVVMILGYSILVIPGGIVSAAWVQSSRKPVTTQSCPDCTREGHDADARFCKFCGGEL